MFGACLCQDLQPGGFTGAKSLLKVQGSAEPAPSHRPCRNGMCRGLGAGSAAAPGGATPAHPCLPESPGKFRKVWIIFVSVRRRCRVVPCRRILSPSEGLNLWRKDSLSPGPVPRSCSFPARCLLALEGWQEAQENEEVKKHPMAGRLEEFFPSAPAFSLGLLASQKLGT